MFCVRCGKELNDENMDAKASAHRIEICKSCLPSFLRRGAFLAISLYVFIFLLFSTFIYLYLQGF